MFDWVLDTSLCSKHINNYFHQIYLLDKSNHKKGHINCSRLTQPYHQRLREYRFYVNIGRGRRFYMADVFILCF